MPAQHPPSGGVHKGRGTGGTEMQDRLHILEDLNMLYIRQMALSLEVTPPPPEYTSACNPASVCALPIPAGAEEGRGACSKWGEGTGGPVYLALSAVCGPMLNSANQSIMLAKGSLHLFLKALWVGVDMCFGPEGSF